MAEQEQITHQLSLLETHRRTLAYFLDRQAKLTSIYATPDVFHGIREAREEIRRIKAVLRDWGTSVEDLPDDEAPVPPTAAAASEQAGVGLTAMAALMSAPAVRGVLSPFQDSFGIICEQIDRLSNYKDLHDLLHDLQFNCYNPIARGARDFPHNTLFVESLGDYHAELQRIVNNLWEVVERADFLVHEQAWIRQLSQAGELLRETIEHSSKQLLDRATFQIGRVLHIHPTRINERLKEAARDLPLSSLIKAMASVQQPERPNLDPEKLHQVGQGIVALEQLDRNLAQLIEEHDSWQEIELELQRLEEGLEQHMQQLEWLWPELKIRIALLCQDRGDRWSMDLRQASERLEGALVTQVPPTIAAMFRPFRRQAGLCFFQTDKKLKELCRSLRRVDGPLSSVLRDIA